MTLQLSDGNLIVPLSVFDVLDTVEEYLGTDVRQYLENYFSEESAWENLPEGEKVDLLLEHYQTVLDGIDETLSDVARLMHQNPVKRKKVIEDLEIVRRIIEKERMNIGKENV